jgi:putative FmdB family regulatory protein
MPIYEYVCNDCESKFELLRPFSQSNKGATCPQCQHEAERVLSVFACFSVDERGLSSPVGGDSCASCSTASCDTCGV